MIHRTLVSSNKLYEGRSVRYEAVVAIATTLNRREALRVVAFLNLLLSSATTETQLKGDLRDCAPPKVHADVAQQANL
jgi:hypothetical protein